MGLFSNCCLARKILQRQEEIKQGTLIGKGFRLDDYKQEHLMDIIQDADNKTYHTLAFGSSGVGKSRLIESMIEQDIPKGENVVIIDPKGDMNLFSKMYQKAKLCGREHEILFISAVYPQYSIFVNPTKNYYMEEELVSHLVSGVPAKDLFFYNVAYETTLAIVKSLLMIRRQTNNPESINFNEVASYVYYEGLRSLQTNIAAISEESEEEKERLDNLFEKVLASPQDYFAKVSSSLRTTLTQMTMGNVGRIVGNVHDNIFIDRLEQNEGVLLYVQTGSMLTRQVSSILSKVIISMIQSLIGRLYASGDAFERKLNIYLDEMGRSLYWGIEDMFAQARAANVSMNGFAQSMLNLTNAVGKEYAETIVDTISSKIIMRLNATNSAKVLTALGGTRNEHSAFLNLDGSIMSRQQEVENIKVEDITRLKKREFYYFGFEGEFKGKTAPVQPSEIKISMPSVIGRNS